MTPTLTHPAHPAARTDRPDHLRLYPESPSLRLHGAPFGVAARLGGICLAADVAVDPVARAALLGRSDAVLCLRGAAWVLAGRFAPVDPPVPEHAPLPGRRCDALARQLRLTPVEVLMVGPVAVTAPERTALDLARLLPEAEALGWLPLLARGTGLDLAALARRFRDQANGPGARVAGVLARAAEGAAHREPAPPSAGRAAPAGQTRSCSPAVGCGLVAPVTR